jgi:hypothetical protein
VADPRVERLKTPEDCEAFAKNAEKTHPELARQARRRAVQLRAAQQGATTPVEQAIWEAVFALESVRSRATGRKARANRTRRSIGDHGAIKAVERIVTRKKGSDGYDVLVEEGMEDFTFEAIVVRNPKSFSSEAAKCSSARLEERRQKK